MQLRKISTQELQEIFAQHKLWVDTEGKKGECANLRGANLRCAHLIRVNLKDADLRGSDLGSANLIRADLRGVNLEDADLICANLIGANLRGANLRCANLIGVAYLIDVNLQGATVDVELQDLFKYRENNKLLKQIANIVVNDQSKINMGAWHAKCGTAHCLAGWASHLTGSQYLEQKYPIHIIGWACLGDEVARRFYDKKEHVLEYLNGIKG